MQRECVRLWLCDKTIPNLSKTDDYLFFSHDLSRWYCSNTVRRNRIQSSKNSCNRPFSLGCFVVPLQTTWYSLENCSFTHQKKCLFIWNEEFSRESSRGLKWHNKPPSRNRNITGNKNEVRKLKRSETIIGQAWNPLFTECTIIIVETSFKKIIN